jgi:hypothetical protein
MAPILAAASALSMAAAAVSAFTAWVAWRARRRAEELTSRYADAVALIALMARAEPPLVAPEVRAACERLLGAHGVEVQITSDRIH